MQMIAMVRTRSFNKTISAPLVALLVMNVPFLGWIHVGLQLKYTQGYEYTAVLLDYATLNPELIPLRKQLLEILQRTRA